MDTMTEKKAKTKAKAEPKVELSAEDLSKDSFYVQLGELSEAMIAKHGKEFAMGTLLLSARFIAEDKPFTKRKEG